MVRKIAARLTPTLTSRLTVFYTLLTGLLGMLMLLFLYLVLLDSLEEKHDGLMSFYASEIEEIYLKQGQEKLKSTLHEVEEDDPDGSQGFIKLIARDSGMLVSTLIDTWPDFPFDVKQFDLLETKQYIFDTISYAHRKNPVRTLHWKIDDSHLLQIGFVLEDDSYVIRKFTAMVGIITFFVIFLSAMIGYFVAKHAMAGIKQITATASSISSGQLTARVPVENQPQEIEQLATTFNIMIDRIESLIDELKNVNNSVAHDLRSPLTRIRGNAEVVLRGDSHLDDYRQMAQTVVEDCEKLEVMINTMLEIASLDSGVTTVNRERLNLTDLLQDAEDLFLPVAESGRQKLVFSIPEEPVFMAGDRSKLQRVVSNLIDNALKFTPSGGEINVRVKQLDHEIELSINDSGPGIALENQNRIFDPFFREDSSRSKPGNGLGLSYVKTIVEKHGGHITVSCFPGLGTTFAIKFSTSESG